jgi:hypothetical protein
VVVSGGSVNVGSLAVLYEIDSVWNLPAEHPAPKDKKINAEINKLIFVLIR